MPIAVVLTSEPRAEVDQVWQALTTGAGMLWTALRALALGCVISADVQILVSREQMAGVLGERGAREAGLASHFGATSSCPFAALAASRSVLVKGAHPVNANAFLITSTNLVVEPGIVLCVLLGRRFTLGNVLLGPVMILDACPLAWLRFPDRLAEDGRRHADAARKAEGMEMEQGGWRAFGGRSSPSARAGAASPAPASWNGGWFGRRS